MGHRDHLHVAMGDGTLSPVVKYANTIAAGALGIVCGFIFLALVRQANGNLMFLLSIPLLAGLGLVMVINLNAMLAAILGVRALLDPVLEMTKISIFGQNIGIGGALNLFVIVLTVVMMVRAHRVGTGVPGNPAWLMYLAICAGTISLSPIPGRAIRVLLNLLSYMCMATLPTLIGMDAKSRNRWLKVLLLASLLPMGMADVSLLGDPSMAGRVRGTFMHPNQLAFYLVFVLALCLYILTDEQIRLGGFRKALLWVHMANAGILLLATKTRSAWVAAWWFLLLFGLLKQRKYLIVALVLPALALAMPSVKERAMEIFAESGRTAHGNLNSFAWRLEVWRSAWPEICKRPIAGHGLASFLPLSHGFFSLATERGVGAHNTYLEVAFETGMLGLLAFVGIFLGYLKELWKRMRAATGNEAVLYTIGVVYLVSYLVVCASDNLTYYLAFNWYFWFFIGLLIARSPMSEAKVCTP